MRRSIFGSVGVVALTLLVTLGRRNLGTDSVPPVASPIAAPLEPAADELPHAFRLPTGEPPALSCQAAQGIIAEVRAKLAAAPTPVDPNALARATSDWLDPHGLWSAAPDAPLAAALELRAHGLLAELEGTGPCRVSRELGTTLVQWIDLLRRDFLQAGPSDTPLDQPIFESGAVTQPARVLSHALGARILSAEERWGDDVRGYSAVARHRYFPELDADGWSQVLLAAAVRAYVPLVDPHGAWAPHDEEASVYELDLEAHAPVRFWERALRTPLGPRIESGALAPLHEGDIVLALGGVITAGLAIEQMDQLGFAISETRGPTEVMVLRGDQVMPLVLRAEPSSREVLAEELATERVVYGDGAALVVTVHEVRDDLGELLARALLRERGGAIAGVLLDLRGNGGGSTDGAMAALGVFLPGASLFPMRRRDGSLEVDRASEPPLVDRWLGPVATLVDGETASAAEMIAGALVSYHRGPSVGERTFGKGCAQEYLDDEMRAGVLRLTTLVFALPDGTPLQRLGLIPTLRLPMTASKANEREALLPHSLPSWKGPDVRTAGLVGHEPSWPRSWPAHRGRVGPCRLPDVCRALLLLGGDETGRGLPRAGAAARGVHRRPSN